MQIYKFMLNCMEPSSRAYVVNTICQDILTSVAEAVFPINRVTSSVVRDCFAVLDSKEIRAFNTDQMSSEFEDGEEEQAVKAELELRKVVLLRNECNLLEKEVKEKKKKENAKKPTSPSSKDQLAEEIKETSRNRSTASKIDYEDINLNDNDIQQPSTSGAQSARQTNVKEAIFSSTPHVLLKPLKFKSHNVSRISVSMDDIDLDSD
ncbi:condensin-2 complex subunit D3 [Trichonephila clavipes]|nr:condensin-2 complex subunit D3 [Trichonephila clavipes]